MILTGENLKAERYSGW